MKTRGVLYATASLAAIALFATGCSSNNDSKDSSSKNNEKTEKVTKAKNKDVSNNKWTYKNDVFDAGNLTYKFTKSEIMDSVTDGKQVLVLYTDVTNNSKKEQDPSNIYMVVHAYQKTDTANKQLDPGIVALDENANSPLQTQEDAMNDKLLPKKTTQGVVLFELENTNKVTVKFSNSDFKDIGSKTYSVQ